MSRPMTVGAVLGGAFAVARAFAGPNIPTTLVYEFPEGDLSFFGTEFVDTFPAPAIANITDARLILTYDTGDDFSGENLVIEVTTPSGETWTSTGSQLGFLGMGTFITGVGTSQLNGIYEVDPGKAFFTVRIRTDMATLPLGGEFDDSRLEIDLEPAMTADLNGDGAVNGKDLAIMLTNWGPCAGVCASDLNTDGVVDGSDLAQLLTSWG